MNQITPFNFKGQGIRVVTIQNEPWFVAKDICQAIGLGNTSEALRSLDGDEKGITQADTLGGSQSLLTVNESGLYALIFKSKKLEAKAFRKFVTSEVLPAIRKTGGYKGGGETQPPPEELTEIRVEILRLNGVMERFIGSKKVKSFEEKFNEELDQSRLPDGRRCFEHEALVEI